MRARRICTGILALLVAAPTGCSSKDTTTEVFDAHIEGVDASFDSASPPDTSCERHEACNGVDDNCDGRVDENTGVDLCLPGNLCMAGACEPFVEYGWDRRFGGPQMDSAGGVGVDADGNIYIAGEFQDTVDFGGGPATLGLTNMFVVSLTPDGTYRWDRTFGENYSLVRPQALHVDSDGNLVVAGFVYSDVDFGGGLIDAMETDLFLVGLDSAGTYRWHYTITFAWGNQTPRDVAVDTAGRTFVAGSYQNEVDFADGDRVCSGTECTFVVSVDAAGAHRWTFTTAGSSGSKSVGNGLAVDPVTGDLVIAGTFEGTEDFGGGARSSAGSGDAFFLRLDADGNHLWDRTLGGTSRDSAGGIAIPSDGSIFATGAHRDSDLGSGSISTGLYLLALKPDGNYLWDRSYDVSTSNEDILVDADGGLILVGRATGSIDFGAGLRSAGLFTLGLDPLGAYRWDYPIKGNSANLTLGTALSPTGDLLVAGRFEATVNFGMASRTSLGRADAFVLSLFRRTAAELAP